MRQKLASLVLLLTITSACNQGQKTTEQIPEEKKATPKTAQIIYTGSVAADGCGYVIRTADNQDLKPVKLLPEFKKDRLKVAVTYKPSKEQFSCGMLPTKMQTIEIATIKKLQ